MSLPRSKCANRFSSFAFFTNAVVGVVVVTVVTTVLVVVVVLDVDVDVDVEFEAGFGALASFGAFGAFAGLTNFTGFAAFSVFGAATAFVAAWPNTEALNAYMTTISEMTYRMKTSYRLAGSASSAMPHEMPGFSLVSSLWEAGK
jgi:hypothetical protein